MKKQWLMFLVLVLIMAQLPGLALGEEAAEPLEITVSVELDSVNAQLGEWQTATWKASGGQEPYSYEYVLLYYNAKDEVISSEIEEQTTVENIRFQPKYGQYCVVVVVVHDSLENVMSDSKSFAIVGGEDVKTFQADVSLDKDTVDAEQDQKITADWELTGGLAPYSIRYFWYADDNVQDMGDGAGGSSSFQPLSGKKGLFVLEATDQLGNRVIEELPFTILSEPVDPLVVKLTLDKTTVNTGEMLEASWEITGGKAPFHIMCMWRIREDESQTNNNTKFDENPKENRSSFAPAHGSRGWCQVTVSDAAGQYTLEEAHFTIEGSEKVDPLMITGSLDKDVVAVNTPFTATWSASGGVPPYTYNTTLWLREVEGGVLNTMPFYNKTTETSRSFTPKFGVGGRVDIHVEDSRGFSTMVTKPFSVTGAVHQPLQVDLSLDKEQVDASQNEAIAATWHISGGSGEYTVDLNWSISEYRSGSFINFVRSVRVTGQGTDSLQVAYGKRGFAELQIRDSAGRFAFANQSFSITGSQTGEGPLQAQIGFSNDAPKGHESLTATASVSGGTAPYTYVFEWFVVDEQKQEHLLFTREENELASAQVNLPNAFTTGMVRIKVKDAEGRTALYAKLFTITTVEQKRGDATDDGKVDEEDLKALVDHLVEEAVLASMEGANADGEGQVDVDDLLAIINMLVGD